MHNKNKQALHAAQIPLRLVVASSAIVLLVLHSTIIIEYSYQGRMDPLGRRPIQPVNAVSDGQRRLSELTVGSSAGVVGVTGVFTKASCNFEGVFECDLRVLF